MADIAELLARVEAATGPDAEIDARLHHALFPDAEVLLDPADVRTRRPSVRGPLRDVSLEGWKDFEGLARHFGAERYSGSIDAAVALVEKVLPGAPWQLCSMPKFGSVRGMPWARINAGKQAFGSTPVLALLSALVRALPSPVHPQGS